MNFYQWLIIFSKHRFACWGVFGCVAIIAFSLFGPLLVDKNLQQLNLEEMFSAPSSRHLFGTDHLGRDLLWQVMEGGRISLWIGFVSTLFASVVGCSYGILSAMSGGWKDRALLFLLDTLQAIPVLLIVILVQAIGDSSILKVILVIGLTSWMTTARLVRIECCRLLEMTFIHAAILSGSSTMRLIIRHLLPNILPSLVIVMTVGIGQAILLETTLSFLNLGIPSTVYSSWGNVMSNGMSAILGGAWWIVIFPGLMIVTTVLCINLIGDGLRDIINPKQRSHLDHV